MKRTIILLAGLAALSGCDDIHIDKKIRIGDEEAKVVAPLEPSGPAAPLSADAEPSLQWAASVVELHAMEDQNAKLFGTAGGDPAMNGLYTYVAFFQGPAEGWAVYRIGDFLSFKVLNEAPGRVDLEVEESTLDEASGQIGSRTRRMIVSWTPGADGAAPSAVSVAPAA